MDKATRALAQRVADLEKTVHRLTQLINAPREQDEAGVSPQDASNKERNSTERKPKSSSQVQPSPSNTNQTKNPWYKTTEGWKTCAELVAIPFAIGYAIVTYYQWQDLRRNFETDARAWVKVQYGLPAVMSETPMVIVNVINFGKSPALESIVDTVFEIVESKNPPSFKFVAGHDVTVLNLIFPTTNNAKNSEFPVAPTPGNRHLTSTELQNLISGQSYVAVFGQVAYRDQFRKQHWTRFCTWQSYAIGPNANQVFNASPCVHYNALGDGNPPKE